MMKLKETLEILIVDDEAAGRGVLHKNTKLVISGWCSSLMNSIKKNDRPAACLLTAMAGFHLMVSCGRFTFYKDWTS